MIVISHTHKDRPTNTLTSNKCRLCDFMRISFHSLSHAASHQQISQRRKLKRSVDEAVLAHHFNIKNKSRFTTLQSYWSRLNLTGPSPPDGRHVQHFLKFQLREEKSFFIVQWICFIICSQMSIPAGAIPLITQSPTAPWLKKTCMQDLLPVQSTSEGVSLFMLGQMQVENPLNTYWYFTRFSVLSLQSRPKSQKKLISFSSASTS